MVSIIVPVFNAEKYLSKCIESLINQTYSNIEIILIDDGSIDNSKSICELYQKKDDRIVFVHKSNTGVSATRNYGLEIAKGQYIAFVDSDDWVHKEFIEQLRNAIDLDADFAICYMNETNEREDLEFLIVNSSKMFLNKKECLKQMLYSSKVGGYLCNKLFKKELITSILKEDIYYSEDFVFCAEYVLNTSKIAVVDAPLYYYWQNLDSVTNKHGVFNYKVFSLLSAQKLLRDIYIENLPEEQDRITLNLLKVALNLRARYKFNKCKDIQQYQEIKETINEFYPVIKKSSKIGIKEKINVFLTKNFPVLSLKLKNAILGRKLKK